MSDDVRYPYTYACDFVRNLAGYGDKGMKIDRVDASCIRQGIAMVLGMADEELAKKLADYFNEHRDEISARGTEQLMASLTERH